MRMKLADEVDESQKGNTTMIDAETWEPLYYITTLPD
jgi:hypothetical protein